jgi:hypothetical protein
MAKHCKGKTKSGKPCRMKPISGSDYCFTHNPVTRRAQAVARKLGGANRHTPHFADPTTLPAQVESLPDAHKLLTYTLAEVAGMDNSIARARILLALYDSFVKSFEIGELEKRIQALEQRGNK